MASDAKALFGCPFCGFRVSTSDVSCPRCGNKFGEGTMFECPFCGDMIPQGAHECPSCHVNFTDFKSRTHPMANEESIDALLMDIIKLESAQIKREEKKKVSCPNCSWMLDGTEDSCPKCGTDFSRDSELQCPICGAFVNAKAARCPECGSFFAGEERAAMEEAEAKQERTTTPLADLLDSVGRKTPLPKEEKPAPPPPLKKVEKPVVITKPQVIPKPRPAAKRPPVEEPPEEPEPARPEEEAKEPTRPAKAPAAKKGKQRKLKTKTPGRTS